MIEKSLISGLMALAMSWLIARKKFKRYHYVIAFFGAFLVSLILRAIIRLFTQLNI